MKTIVHLLRKDLCRYAWAVLALAVLAGIEVYLHGTGSGLLDNGANKALTLMTGVVGSVLFFILIVMVVQEETLADSDAYWLARPLPRGKLLAAKILFVLILIGISTLSEAITMILNGGAARLGYVALGVLASLAIWNWQIFLAAQTRSLARYLLFLVVLVLGFYAVVFAVFYLDIWSWLPAGFELGQLPGDTPGHVVVLIQSFFWLFFGIGLLGFLYLERRPRYCWLLLLPAVFVSAVLSPSKSFYGLGRSSAEMTDATRLKVDHLRTGGALYAMGGEFVEIEAVFEPVGGGFDQDAWVTTTWVELEAGGQAVDFNFSRVSQRLAEDADGRRYLSLGQIKLAELEKVGTALDLGLALEISFSEPVESGRLELREGSGYAGDGNRLVVRNLYRHDGRLTATLAAVIPRFALERDQDYARSDPFKGRFSFALAGKGDGRQAADFRLSGFQTPMSLVQTARLEAPLARRENLQDYEIVVYSRRMTGQFFDYLTGKNVSVRRH